MYIVYKQNSLTVKKKFEKYKETINQQFNEFIESSISH